MKIQETSTPKLNSINLSASGQKTNRSNQKVSFTGAEAFTAFLRFLETNQAWGATAVDATCMGIPRTTVDFSRGPDAGFETMRREFSSTADDALVGVYGLGAAWLLSQTFNKKFGINAHKMFVSDEMLNILGATWNEKRISKEPLKEFLEDIVGKAKGFNPNYTHENAETLKKLKDEKGWVKIDEKAHPQVVEKFFNEIENGPEKLTKETKAHLKALIAGSTGAENKFKIEKTLKGKSIEAVSSLDDFIENTYKISKTFMNNKVAETFKTGNISDNIFIKGLGKLNRNASLIGVGVATAIGCSLQPLNMYLTRKKTGKTGFVGVEGREPDNSKGFNLLKIVAAGSAWLAVMRTIGKSTPEILRSIQFKGLIPTIPQYKFVYGLTVVSRLLSARDKNELRESTIKDSLGFANWLILGGFVSKLTAAGIEKMDKFKNDKFIRYNEGENGKGFFNWLTKSSIVTRDEVLHSALKGKTIKSDGKAMTFREMMKAAPASAKTKVKYLGLIQLSGYLYSGLVLGMGIPKLNIAITKAVEKKRKAKAEIGNSK